MKKAIWILALVSLLFLGMLPVVEAPNSQTWNIRYEANNVLPEDDGWTRTTTGTTSRAFMYYNQILNITMTGATTDLEAYEYNFTSTTDFVVLEARVNIPVAYPTTVRQNINLDIYMTDNSELSIQTWYNNKVFIYYPNQPGSHTSIGQYVGNYTTVNHTYTLIAYQEDGLSQMDFYFDYNYVGHVESYQELSFKSVRWNCIDSTAETKYFEWDYVLVRTENLGDWGEDIEKLKREIEDLKARLPDEGYIENPMNEAYIPYPTRDFLGEAGWVYIDPYVTWTYRIIDEQGPGTSNTHVQTYPSSVSDYTILEDEVRWTWPGSATRIWLNQSSTELLDTTDDSYSSWDLVKNNITLAGKALTFDTLADSSRSVRYTTVQIIQSFNWLMNPITQEHTCIVGLTNSLGIDAVRMQVYVAAPEDKTIDESTVEIIDNTNAYTMEAGKNFIVTPSGFLWETQFWNNSDALSYSITFSPWQSGSSIVEPIGVFDYSASSNRELSNIIWLYDEVPVTNPNNFDYTNSRVTLDLREIPGNIQMIRVRDSAGTEYALGPPLGNKYYTILGVTIDAHGVKNLEVYVKAPDPTLSPGWFQLHGLWIFALFFIMLIISFLGWMWAVSVPGMKNYAGPIAAFFWFNVLMTMLFGVLTFLAGG